MALALTALSLARRVAHRRRTCTGSARCRASLATAVPLFFVLAGDFRYLLLWEVATPDGAIALIAARRRARRGRSRRSFRSSR